MFFEVKQKFVKNYVKSNTVVFQGCVYISVYTPHLHKRTLARIHMHFLFFQYYSNYGEKTLEHANTTSIADKHFICCYSELYTHNDVLFIFKLFFRKCLF